MESDIAILATVVLGFSVLGTIIVRLAREIDRLKADRDHLFMVETRSVKNFTDLARIVEVVARRQSFRVVS